MLLAQPAFVIVATVHIIRAKPADAIVTYAVAARPGWRGWLWPVVLELVARFVRLGVPTPAA